MNTEMLDRRDFIKSLLGGIPLAMLDWDAFPRGNALGERPDTYDAVIIGSGLGGLSCAAGFARQGFKPLVLEKHDRPGGYASTFARPGGFVFDVSLHSTTAQERNGVANLIPGFPEITDVEFVPHPSLYRAVYPEHDIRVPQKNVGAYIELLCRYFPEEREKIQGLIDDMKSLSSDIGRISSARGQLDMSKFPQEYPSLFRYHNKTWGEMMDGRITNPKLRTIVSALWAYFGLPPSRLSTLYYALPTLGYLQGGGWYPKGRSQKLSYALVRFIEQRGGKVILDRKVNQILTKDHAAYGVRCDDGKEYLGKVVVSNASAYDTFHTLLKEGEYIREYVTKMNQFSVSLSCFQVFLGLDSDLVGKLGLIDSEIFYETGYDIESSYASALNADVENGGYALTLYDNVYRGYSPPGKNTLTIMVLQGYDHWEQYESDYFKGTKEEYNAEKERIATRLIKSVESTLMPGLSDAIEVKEIGTPLTNLRYTGNYRGAIYGWDQTVNNSGQARLAHTTPIRNLYLAGAWTRPGHGYMAVLPSGLECFGEIMSTW